jgi:hypothetical protein
MFKVAVWSRAHYRLLETPTLTRSWASSACAAAVPSCLEGRTGRHAHLGKAKPNSSARRERKILSGAQGVGGIVRLLVAAEEQHAVALPMYEPPACLPRYEVRGREYLLHLPCLRLWIHVYPDRRRQECTASALPRRPGACQAYMCGVRDYIHTCAHTHREISK